MRGINVVDPFETRYKHLNKKWKRDHTNPPGQAIGIALYDYSSIVPRAVLLYCAMVCGVVPILHVSPLMSSNLGALGCAGN